MSKFYVGQRVRYVKHLPDADFTTKGVALGTLGTVTGHGPVTGLPGEFNYVLFDGSHSGWCTGEWAVADDQIEPVEDDGEDMADWRDVEQMLPWKREVAA